MKESIIFDIDYVSPLVWMYRSSHNNAGRGPQIL
jgi:hypothetical protein